MSTRHIVECAVFPSFAVLTCVVTSPVANSLTVAAAVIAFSVWLFVTYRRTIVAPSYTFLSAAFALAFLPLLFWVWLTILSDYFVDEPAAFLAQLLSQTSAAQLYLLLVPRASS